MTAKLWGAGRGRRVAKKKAVTLAVLRREALTVAAKGYVERIAELEAACRAVLAADELNAQCFNTSHDSATDDDCEDCQRSFAYWAAVRESRAKVDAALKRDSA